MINGKFYIGKHQTKDLDDGYMGSGKLLKMAIAKYGIENFKKDILEVYDQEWKMNLAERVLVVIDPEISYNLCSGGKGGFGYINDNLSIEERSNRGKTGGKSCFNKYGHLNKTHNPESYKKAAFTRIKRYGGAISEKCHMASKSLDSMKKQKLTMKIKMHQQGYKNSQFGTCWITDGIKNRKVKKESLDNLETGWYKGRVQASNTF